MNRLRDVCLVLLCVWSALASAAAGGEGARGRDIVLSDILPEDTILFVQRPSKQLLDKEFQNTSLKRISDHPDMREFLTDWTQGTDRYVRDVAEMAKLSPAFVSSLLDGQLSIAVLDALVDDSGLDVSYCFAFQMEQAATEQMVYNAVLAAVQRLRRVYDDPRAPKNLVIVNREQKIGNHNVFRIIHEKPIRFMVLGKTILFYRARRRDGLEEIVANYDNVLTARTLARSAVYRKVYAGAETRPGMSFLYINSRRFHGLLGALGIPEIMRILDVTGISGVQAIGCAGGSYKSGIKHTAYLLAPGQRVGLLEAITMKSGAELAAMELPGDSYGILATRVDLATLYQKLPELADSIEKAIGRKTPLGIASLAGRQTVLGVPAKEMLAPLGDAVIGQPGPAGPVLRFDLVQVDAFENILKRMEASLGHAFERKTVQCADGASRVVRYYRDVTGKTPLPLAPSFCVYKRKDRGLGVVYIATHPQTIVAVLRQKASSSLKDAPDYKKVMEGMGSNYGVFAYLDNRRSYEQIYDWALPLLNLMNARPNYLPDAGKLPPGHEISPHLFGMGMGIRSDQQGITFTAYSPLGMGAGLVTLVDTPVIHGFLATAVAGYLGSEYHFQKTGKHLIDTSVFGLDPADAPTRTAPGERIPGISD